MVRWPQLRTEIGVCSNREVQRFIKSHVAGVLRSPNHAIEVCSQCLKGNSVSAYQAQSGKLASLEEGRRYLAVLHRLERLLRLAERLLKACTRMQNPHRRGCFVHGRAIRCVATGVLG